MNWKTDYQNKIMSAEEAIALIQPGEGLVLSQASTPNVMVATLAAHKERFKGNSVFNIINLGDMSLAHADMEGHFEFSTIFTSGSTRQDINDGRAHHIPAHFHAVPGLLGDTVACDVAVLAMTRPDAEGYCSLSLGVDYALQAAKVARLVIGECNDQLPYTFGDSRVHVSQLGAVVEVSYPPKQNPQPTLGEVEMAIGRHCAGLIHDGDCLQLGIGALPDAVLLSLKDKKDLGIHSEMFSDGVVELVEEGVITNAHKQLHPGKLVATFLIGTSRLYDFVNDNLDVEMHPVDYVNAPWIVAKNDNVVAINSAIQVDLTGQVCAESIGLRHYSGSGGQVDFIRGAAMSKGGRSIIALASTSMGGKASRIVPVLEEGAAVTTPRTDVHYVVTEYGVADLKGRTQQDRARALIAIAHPDFRPELIEHFEARFKRAF